MFASAFFCLALLCVSAYADAFGAVDLHLQAWSAPCSPVASNQPQACAQPKALAPEFTVNLNANATTQSSLASQPWSLGTQLNGVVTTVAVPATTSAPAYVQIRIELIQPVRALCLTSQKWEDQAALVPIICVGFDSQSLIETGLTVTGTLGLRGQ